MPIYEYRCSKCGHEIEALQKLSDAPLTDCPACQAAALVKKVSAAGFQLKGSGWYVTDFRGGAGSKSATSGENGKTESKSETKTESKTEAGSSGDSSGAAKSESKTPATSTPAPASDTSG